MSPSKHGWWSVVASIALWAAIGCGGATVGNGKDGAGSETDWLSQCVEDSDCNQGSCLCGICTRPCSVDDMCGSIDGATCHDDARLQGCAEAPPEDRGLCADDRGLTDALEAAAEGADDDDPTNEDDDPPEDDDDPVATPGAPAAAVPGQVGGPADKLDLLFVIDNSASMAQKQKLLADALPDLVSRFVDPLCVSAAGESAPAAGDECPDGFRREFRPVSDVHIGVITSSLGGYGSELDCINADEGETDNSHLLGSLGRVRGDLPDTPEFLSWCQPGGEGETSGSCAPTPETSGGDATVFAAMFADQVRAAREQGCGWESTLESWYRFLVEPYPWTKVVRQNCPFGGDANQLCVAEAILALTGDAARGRQLFLEAAGVQCKNCHKLGDAGKALGPDLTTIGKKLDRAKLLESILQPSLTIDPQFATYLVETESGLVHTGLLVRRTDAEVVLKSADGKELSIPAADISRLAPQQKSLMPDLLLQEMTAQQVADLLELLAGLK
jgi:putative heme-binding domain-containing protein